MLTQEMKEILQDPVHIFQPTYFESCQIYQLTIMYRFEHTNHDILQNFLFQNLYNLLVFFGFFCVRVICSSNLFHT